ncbi:MAG: hypothetical protein ACI4P5_09620, partial [Candidatus Fimadaptatus sp.]
FVVPPVGQVNEKKILLLSSGDYPEVFLGGTFTNVEVMQYGVEDEILLPLNDLIDEYGDEILKAYEEIPTLREDTTAPDGNIYGLANVNQCYHCSILPKCYVYTPFLEALGMETPTTTDEYYEYLKAVVNNDPNGNGLKDEVGHTGAINTWYAEPHYFLLSPFVEFNDNYYFIVKDGKISTCADTEELREGLRYVHKLYSEGLIDSAAYTQSGTQLSQIANAEVPVLGAYSSGHIGMGVNIETERSRDFDVVLPLKGPDGTQNAMWLDVARVSSVAFVITDKCANPDVAIRVGDFMYSELATANSEYGLEGTAWERASEGMLGYDGTTIAKRAFLSQAHGSEQRATENTRWYQSALQYRPFRYRAEWAADQDIYGSDGYETRLNLYTQMYEPYKQSEVMPPVFLDASVAEEVTMLQTNIKDYIKSNIVQFIIGEKDIDNDWDAYVAGLEQLDMARYIEIYQNALDARG